MKTSPALMLTNPYTLGVFENEIAQDRRHPSRQRRAALHGRRQHERAGRHGAARRFRRRRHAPEPAQDLLHAHGGGGPGSGPVAVQVVPRAFLPTRLPETRSGTLLELRPPPLRRPRSQPSTATSACSSVRSHTSWRTAPTVCDRATEDAVLNANYIRKNLEDLYDRPTRRRRCTRWFSATSGRRPRA